MPDHTATHHLQRDPLAIGSVRAWVVDELRSRTPLSRARIDDAAVMVSELATNVIRHTGSEAEIAITTDEGSVRIDVHDDDQGHPEVQPLDPGRVGGNGLRIVEAWSTEWGVSRRPGGGKTVWLCISF
jgi:anti-sigma regulatory factor (Ser/Thr protein kinase)